MNQNFKSGIMETKEVIFTGIYYTVEGEGKMKFRITGVVDPNNLKKAKKNSTAAPHISKFKLVPFLNKTRDIINSIDNRASVAVINWKTKKDVAHLRYFCDPKGRKYFYDTNDIRYFISDDGLSCLSEYGSYYEITENYDLIPVDYPRNGFVYSYVNDRALKRSYQDEDTPLGIDDNPFGKSEPNKVIHLNDYQSVSYVEEPKENKVIQLEDYRGFRR